MENLVSQVDALNASLDSLQPLTVALSFAGGDEKANVQNLKERFESLRRMIHALEKRIDLCDELLSEE